MPTPINKQEKAYKARVWTCTQTKLTSIIARLNLGIDHHSLISIGIDDHFLISDSKQSLRYAIAQVESCLACRHTRAGPIPGRTKPMLSTLVSVRFRSGPLGMFSWFRHIECRTRNISIWNQTCTQSHEIAFDSSIHFKGQIVMKICRARATGKIYDYHGLRNNSEGFDRTVDRKCFRGIV